MTPKFPFRSTVILLIVSLLAIIIPNLLQEFGLMGAYIARILILGGVNAIMAMSVNMIVGITGQLSIGQAGFLAIGAYATIFFHLDMGFPLFVAALCAILITAFSGFLLGFPVLKMSGDYLAIVTLGFGEIIRIIFINVTPLSGGPGGRAMISPLIFNFPLALAVVTSSLIVFLVLVQNFLRSSYGRAIMACREDEIAANACGINIFRYKMIGFVVAAAIAGMGGSLFIMVNGLIQPEVAGFVRSVDFLIFVVLGGMGSMTGSIVAAYALTYLQELLRVFGDFRLLVYPILLIFIIIFRPQGLLGTKEISFVGIVDRIGARIANRKKGNQHG